MFVTLVTFVGAWMTLLGDTSSAYGSCVMTSYPHYYPSCFKWTLLKENDEECTKISLGGHSTSLFDNRITQRLESPFLLTKWFPDFVEEDNTTVSSECISTKTKSHMNVSVTDHRGSIANSLTHTVDSTSTISTISTTGSTVLNTDYKQLGTTGDEHINNEETSTSGYEQLSSEVVSTNIFQQSSESVPNKQLNSTENYDHHTTADNKTPDIYMSTLTLPLNGTTTKSTTIQTTTEAPKLTTTFTSENTTPSSTVQKSSLMSSQGNTTSPISTVVFETTTPDFTTAEYCKSAIYKTEDNGVFRFFIEDQGGIHSMQFQAKANNGIRVTLLTSLSVKDFVEIKIGGKANDRSEIRSCSMGQCSLKTEVNTPQYLAMDEFRDFWIEHTSGESLSVGRNEEVAFMQWNGLPSLDLKYIAFSTDAFTHGEFKFCNQNGIATQSAVLLPCPKVVDQLSCTCELPPFETDANVCHCHDRSNDLMCIWLPNDCNQIWQNGVLGGGLYTVYPIRSRDLPFPVYCNMTADEGWTMLQRRVDGSVDFFRDYRNYKEGFGILEHEFWLGNKKIFQLTNQQSYTLRIDMVIDGGIHAFAEYDAFRINDEMDDFRLVSLGSYTGSVYDSMALSLDMKFSTIDHDRDLYGGSCASISIGSWWYRGINAWCYDANLNGVYGDDHVRGAIIWYEGTVVTFDYLLTYVDMKIRPNSGAVK